MTASRSRVRKGAVAGAVGIALLAAGGGSFATWSDSQDLAGAEITSGHLRIDEATAVWTAGGTEIDIKNYLVIPGSVLTYTATVDVALEGDGLAAQFATTLPDAMTTADGADGADDELAGALTVDLMVEGETGSAVTIAEDGQYTVVATITFPENPAPGADWGQTAQDATAELADFQITLEQQL